jgi:DNA primase large subunit
MPLQPPAIEDPVVTARYPFLPQANAAIKAHMEANKINLEALVDTEWLEAVRVRARVRLVESVVSKDIDATTTIDIHTPYGQMVECLSFLYAMVTVCASFDERLLGRWAEGEASRADQLWGNIETPDSFQRLAETYLRGVRIGEDGNWEVSMLDFIEICPKISGSYWRLPNRPVLNGWVILSPGAKGNSQKQLSRLLKERIRTQLIEECRGRMEKMDEAFTGRMAEEVGRIVGLLQHQATTEVSFTSAEEGDWPPCMQEISTQLAQSVNINHVGRVFLASMSRVIGLTVDEAQAFFVNAPDYSADTTRYQLNHVYEHEYTPAGCPKLQINACCPITRGDAKSDLCNREWMNHPLKYLRARQRAKHREEQANAPPVVEQ